MELERLRFSASSGEATSEAKPAPENEEARLVLDRGKKKSARKKTDKVMGCQASPRNGRSKQSLHRIQSPVSLDSPSTPRSGDILDMRIEDLSSEGESPLAISSAADTSFPIQHKIEPIAKEIQGNGAARSLKSLKDAAIAALAHAERSLAAMRLTSQQVCESLDRRIRREGRAQEGETGQMPKRETIGFREDSPMTSHASPVDKSPSQSLAFTSATHSLSRHLQQSIDTPFLLEANRRCTEDSTNETGSTTTTRDSK